MYLDIFNTDSGNTYFHSQKVNRFLITHPVMHYLLRLKNNGINVERWVQEFNWDIFEIEGIGLFSKKEVEFYLQKLLLWIENGYLEPLPISDILNGKLNAITIKSLLANTPQFVMEITEACNLACHYCGYGKLYKNFKDNRKGKNLSFAVTRRLLDYLVELWNSALNISHKKSIDLGFYGGEPLIAFPFIKKIVDYSKTISLRHNYFEYGMTTNGVLLHKYMDFLAENNFRLLISLDGDEISSGYRLFHDGKTSYPLVILNAKQLRARYPSYFDKKVNFCSVLHNKNSVAGIHQFFKDEFNKTPMILEVNAEGIDPDFKDEFWQTYKNFKESAAQAENYSVLENDIFEKLPEFRDTFRMIRSYGGFVYTRFKELVFKEQREHCIPTATCLPFTRKIFLTATGKILPCERIDFNYFLGTVDEEEVHLDFEQIAEKYNGYYENVRRSCHTCSRTKNCNQCIFTMDISSNNPKCYGHMNQTEFLEFLSTNMSLLENKPEIYNKFMKDVVIL